MKANHTYETIIKNKLDLVNGPDTDMMWGDMKGILDIHMPQKKKRRFMGWWFFDGSGMYIGIAALITLGTITGYRILNNKENIATTSTETQSLKQSETADKKNLTGSENNITDRITPQGTASIKESSSNQIQKTADQKSADNKNLSETNNNNNNNVTSRLSKGGKSKLFSNAIQKQSGSVNSNNKIAGINKNNQSPVRDQVISGLTRKETTISLYNSENFNSLLTVKQQKQNFRIIDIGNKKSAEDLIAKLNQPQKKGWVIGGSFNFHMPLSSQQISTLNMNGKKGNLVDYLPSIYVQYHLNDKLYLQSEIQYSAPQHTPNHILFDEWNNMTTHQKEENLVYLDKLYYLNIPVTIHYSPLKNIQFGSGIQLSHLMKSILTDEQAVWQNGMEGWQKTVVNTQVYSKSPGAGSNNGSMPARVDTALQNFKSNDLRMVLDANYNWHKLNVGFSLNIGLTNYLNSKAGINSISIKDRNEDLKIYLKYKLWDQRRKKVKP